MKIKKIVNDCLWAITLTFVTLPLMAQSVPCNIAGNFTSTGDSVILDNRNLGCYQWRVAYTSTGFSGISISLQSSATQTGSYSDFTGATVVTDGINPSTSTTNAIIGIHSNGAFIKLHLGTATGTGKVIYQVWGANSTTSSASSLITGTSPIVVAGNNVSCPSCGTSSGSVTSVGTTAPLTGGPITTTGSVACATCVTSAASLTNNAFVFGAGGQASQAVTAVTATAALNLFSSTLQGLVPLSGGGTTNFLRADGVFAAPPGGGSGGITNQSVVSGSRTVGTVFQNTGTTAIFVSATVFSNLNSLFTGLTDSSNPPTTQVIAMSLLATVGSPFGFWVLPGNFYKITSSAGTPTVFLWTEWN